MLWGLGSKGSDGYVWRSFSVHLVLDAKGNVQNASACRMGEQTQVNCHITAEVWRILQSEEDNVLEDTVHRKPKKERDGGGGEPQGI